MGTTSPQSTWEHLTYPIPGNIAAELHPFQAYILKMAALDYVHRPPPLSESGEEMNFYQGFEDQHDLLLSWVLESGFSEPIPQLGKVDGADLILFERHPLAVGFLDTALEISVTQATIQRFSENPLPLSLARYAERSSAGLSGFRMNVLWTAAQRYAEMMVEDAARGGDERYVIGGETLLDLVTQERSPKNAVYIQDVNLATFCAFNAEFEKYVFNNESSCNWWWNEESHADKIRELLKHTVRLALDMACRTKGVELVIYPFTVASSDSDSCELEDSLPEEDDLYLEDEEPPEDTKFTEEHTDNHEMHDTTVDDGKGNIAQYPDTDSDAESIYGCCPRARSRSPTYSPRDGSPLEESENEFGQEKRDDPYFEDFTGASFTTTNTIQPSDLSRGWKPYQPTVPTRNIMIDGKWLCVEVPERKLSPTITEDMLQDYPKRVELAHLLEKKGGSFGRPEKRRADMTEGETDKGAEEAMEEKPRLKKRARIEHWKAFKRHRKALSDKAKKLAKEAPENLAQYLRDAENGDIESAVTTSVEECGGAENENGRKRRIWLRGREPGEGDGREILENS